MQASLFLGASMIVSQCKHHCCLMQERLFLNARIIDSQGQNGRVFKAKASIRRGGRVAG
jgi:hypothetical protein